MAKEMRRKVTCGDPEEWTYPLCSKAVGARTVSFEKTDTVRRTGRVGGPDGMRTVGPTRAKTTAGRRISTASLPIRWSSAW